MPEIKTPPVISTDNEGDEVICFNSSHTLADIARWILQNRTDAEEVYYILGEELGCIK